MCGIVGYIGEEQATPILLSGLQKLEYRGYDSAGVAVYNDTDTEVVAQLLEYYYKGDVLATIQKVISKAEGSYALGILCADCPEKLYAVRKDNPLIIGVEEGENYIALDVPAILSRTRNIYRLKGQEIAVLTRGHHRLLRPGAGAHYKREGAGAVGRSSRGKGRLGAQLLFRGLVDFLSA